MGPSILGFGVLKLSPSIARKFSESRACLGWLARIARTMERPLEQPFLAKARYYPLAWMDSA